MSLCDALCVIHHDTSKSWKGFSGIRQLFSSHLFVHDKAGNQTALPLLAGPDMFRLLKVCSSSSKPLSGCAAKSEHKLEWRNDLHPFIVKELGPCELEWQGILPCPSNFPKS